MYTIHFIETASKFNSSYNSVAKQNNIEVNMKKEKVQKSEYKTMTQNQPNRPVNH